MSAKTVFVLGELNVDAIISGSNIQPEPNKEKLVDDFEITLGSSSAITACRLAQLGLEVYFVSVIGDDQFGRYCLDRLQHFGVRTDFVRTDAVEKTGITVSLSTPEDRALLTYMGTIPKLAPQFLPEEMFAIADHIHFGSFFLQKGMRDSWVSLFAKARAHGITTSFDLGWDPEEQWGRSRINELLAVTDLFVPSETELLHVYECKLIEELNGELPERTGRIAVKQGRDGSSLRTPDGRWIHAPGYSVQAVDTTGAGDSFNAGAIKSFLAGKADADILAWGNACGALSTLAVGGTGGILTVGDVESLIQSK